MQKLSTHFLRLAILVMGLIVLALCVFALPNIYHGGSAEFPMASTAILLIVIGLYATTIPFYIALWQTFKLLRYIDDNTALSNLSVQALRNIKHCAAVIAAFYVAGWPLLYPIADADDAPGLILIGGVIAGIPIVVAVFAGVLEKLLRKAISLKSE